MIYAKHFSAGKVDTLYYWMIGHLKLWLMVGPPYSNAGHLSPRFVYSAHTAT